MNSREGLVVILSRRTRSRSEQKRAEERVAAGLCTMKHQIPNSTSDDLVDCNAPTIVNGRSIGTRGCCARCYQSFVNYLGSMPPAWPGTAGRGVAWRGLAWPGTAWLGVAWHGKARQGFFTDATWKIKFTSFRMVLVFTRLELQIDVS